MNWSDEEVYLCFLAFVHLMTLNTVKDLCGDTLLITGKTGEKPCKQVACCLSNQ